MKILHVVHVTPFYPPHTGGMENVVRELATRRSASGKGVEVITTRLPETGQPVKDDFTVTRLSAHEVAHTPLVRRLLPRLFKTPKNSLFHIHLSIAGFPELALLVAKMRRLPTVLHFHLDVGRSGRLGLLLNIYKKTLFTWTIRRGDIVLALSVDQAQFLEKKYRVDPAKIRVLPNGVSEEFFMVKNRKAPAKKMELLFVGRLNTQKRVERIVAAMKIIESDCRLTIVGEGEDLPKLKALATKLKLKNVRFVGKKTGRNLVGYYRRSDVLLLPSDIEGMSLVMLEALASGLPIIASSVPGIKEHLIGTSILIKKPSPESFAAAIDDLYKNRVSYIPRLSLASSRLAKKYAWKKIAESLEGIYKELSVKPIRQLQSNKGKLRLFSITTVWWLALIGLRAAPHTPAVFVNTVGFSFLILMPGLLTCLCLNLKQQSTAAKLIMAVGFSVLELMLAGLAGNTILQLIGIKRPLDTPFVIGEVSTLLAVLYLSVWRYGGPVRFRITSKLKAIFPTKPEKLFAFVPMIFVILAVLGTTSLNNGGSNLLVVVNLIGIAGFSGLLVIKSRKLGDNTVATALFFTALAMLFMTSLRGWFTTGHDIQREFGVFELTKSSGVWRIQQFRDPYNACLSITILPTMIFNLLKTFDPYVYKIFFQIIFALTPPLLYLFTRKWTSKALAYTAMLYFVAFPTFFTDMPMLNRQEIALLFFGLMLYIIFQDGLALRFRRALFLAFGSGLILSHYSTTYSVVIILLISVLIRPVLVWIAKFLKGRSTFQHSALNALRAKSSEIKRITFTSVVIITVGSFLWTSVLTNTGNNTGRVVRATLTAVLHSFKEDAAKANETKYNLLSFSRADLQKEFNDYTNQVVNKARAKSPETFYPESTYKDSPLDITTSNVLPLTGLGGFASRHGVRVEGFNQALRQGSAKVLQLLILLGLVYVLFRRSILRSLDTEYLTLVIGCVIFVAMQVVLPVISVEYGLLRAFQQSLMLFSIFIVLGSIVLFKPVPGKKLKAVLPIVLSLMFFVSSTGLVTQSLGGYPAQLNLNNSGTYYDIYYLHKTEVVGVDWLTRQAKEQIGPEYIQSIVQTDPFSFSKQNYLFEINPLSDINPGLVRRDAYVYLGYSNVTKNQATVSFNGNTLTYNYPVKFLDDNKNLLYDNGGSRVYK